MLCLLDHQTDTTTLELPVAAEQYTLSSDHVSSPVMKLNGRDLVMGVNNELPNLSAARQEAGTIVLAPSPITFLVF